MKKTIALISAWCGLFLLTGCIEDKVLPFPTDSALQNAASDETSDNSYLDIDWTSFTFESLTPSEDLTVTKGPFTDGALSVSTSKYPGEFLVVAVYSTDCELCKTQAPWLNKLADEISHSVNNVNFIVIFADLFADSDNKEVAWMKNLPYLDAYTNVTNACSGNVCKQVFAPQSIESAAPTIYFVDKRNILRSWEAIPWSRNQDSAKMYREMKNELLDFMDLQPISFDTTTGTTTSDIGPE